MKIRRHKELLDESMETVEDIEPTFAAIEEYLNRSTLCDWKWKVCEVKPYGYDKRIGWDTYIVLAVLVSPPNLQESGADDAWVVAFTDGPATK